MCSFQQILMGGTCLVAAFFFGSYLHNRPAENEQPASGQLAAAADPLETLLAFRKQPAAESGVIQPRVAQEEQSQAQTQPSAGTVRGIDSSELVPSVQQSVANEQSQNKGGLVVESPVVESASRRPVVPDFSELASRFRNTPLELAKTESATSNNRGVHESERAPFSNVFEAPELVVRQPEITQPPAILSREVDRMEEAIRGEFSSVEPETTRWRVNRTRELDRFRRNGQAPQPYLETKETIEDVLARRSADYLHNDESSNVTWATNPPQDNSVNARRREITMNAAKRNRNILDIEDPGNRFRSVLTQPDSVLTQPENVAPPEPDVETAYYTPSAQRQDMIPPTPRGNLKPLHAAATSNWSRQSNIQSQFQNTYEIQPGDTLQSISARFYGTPEYYLELYKANKKVLKRIASSSYVGVVIEIPQLNN